MQFCTAPVFWKMAAQWKGLGLTVIIEELESLPDFYINEEKDFENSEVTSEMEVSEVMAKIKDGNVKLTEYGKTFVKKWLKNKGKGKKQNVMELNIKDYPAICYDAERFFQSGIKDKFEGPKLILDIIKECSKDTMLQKGVVIVKDITELEKDGIEYLAGYTVKKASVIYPNLASLLKKEEPAGKLIPLMEKKAGVLEYPSDELLTFLEYCFKEAEVETQKQRTAIDFCDLSRRLIESNNFRHFLYYLNDISCKNYFDVLSYIVKLFIRVLSYTFAKKLFTKYFGDKVPKGSKGLRTDLKNKYNDK